MTGGMSSSVTCGSMVDVTVFEMTVRIVVLTDIAMDVARDYSWYNNCCDGGCNI